MVFLHAAVRLEDQRVAQLRVLFPDDRVERDLVYSATRRWRSSLSVRSF
jgi:hypothetical protein